MQLVSTDEGRIWKINLGDDENRLDLELFKIFHQYLDKIEKTDGNCAIIIKGEGKFFSNGLCIESLSKDPKALLESFHELLLRILVFPVPVIAAINGHAFAGGAFLALAADYRVMNSQHGFLCINEVDLGFNLTPGLFAILKAKLNKSLYATVVLEAKRFNAKAALGASLVDSAVPLDQLDTEAERIARLHSSKGSVRNAYRTLKLQMYEDEIKLLRRQGIGYAEEILSMFCSKL